MTVRQLTYKIHKVSKQQYLIKEILDIQKLKI